jgi:hypothetical protein
MSHANPHIPDHDLLLAAEGELSARRALQIDKHLGDCAICRERKEELERIAAGAFRAYRSESSPSVSSDSTARSALIAQMQEISGPRRHSWLPRISQAIELRALALVCGLLLLTGIGINVLPRVTSSRDAISESELAVGPVVPNASLTPGAVRAISLGQVCTLESPAETAQIPPRVKKMVFHEYGMDGAPPLNYEVDHLITPALGGTDDIRNLWPEPYSSEWNARVKDQLENRLHELVCKGELDLATAQHDIASNWISAYRKYFHTDRPLPADSKLMNPLPASRHIRQLTMDESRGELIAAAPEVANDFDEDYSHPMGAL